MNELVAFSPAVIADALEAEHGAPLAWRGALEHVLGRAYRVSLYKDEGRPLRFSLALTSVDVPLPSEQLLAVPAPADAGSLRRLSVAVEAGRSCLHVACGEDEEGPVARIVGLCARPELMEVAGTGQVLLVDVTDPACVSLKSARSEVRYERDAWYVPAGRAALERLLPDGLEDAVLTLLRTDARSMTLPTRAVDGRDAVTSLHAFAGEVRALARPTVGEGLALLVAEVRRLGHGGTVLVLPEAARDGMARMQLDQITLDAHRFERARRGRGAEPWNQGLLEALAWSASRNLAVRGASAPADGAALPEWALDAAHVRCEQAMARWRADARRIAHLTQVDGALVLDALLEPLLFGLKIGLENSAFLPDAWREILMTRGTRHRATACLADAVPDALAVAISQDGGVTVFRKGFRHALVETLTI